jgi:hypothetical protein
MIVEGVVYVDAIETASEEFDDIFWIVDDSDRNLLNSPEFFGRKILALIEKEVSKKFIAEFMLGYLNA